jgi:hypothetical protein
MPKSLRRSFRFSILNLLLLMAAVAFAVALYLKNERLHESTRELQRLRSEAGYISIDDSKQVHVVAVPVPGPYRYRWRVYLPGGKDFGLFTYQGKVSKTKLPENPRAVHRNGLGAQSSPFEDREVLIDAVLEPRYDGGYHFTLSENGDSKTAIIFPHGLPEWDNDMMPMEFVAGRKGTVASDIAIPIKLLRIDGVNASGETSNDAILIWVGEWTKNGFEAAEALKKAK